MSLIQYAFDEVIEKNTRDSEFIYMVVKVTAPTIGHYLV